MNFFLCFAVVPNGPLAECHIIICVKNPGIVSVSHIFFLWFARKCELPLVYATSMIDIKEEKQKIE